MASYNVVCFSRPRRVGGDGGEAASLVNGGLLRLPGGAVQLRNGYDAHLGQRPVGGPGGLPENCRLRSGVTPHLVASVPNEGKSMDLGKFRQRQNHASGIHVPCFVQEPTCVDAVSRNPCPQTRPRMRARDPPTRQPRTRQRGPTPKQTKPDSLTATTGQPRPRGAPASLRPTTQTEPPVPRCAAKSLARWPAEGTHWCAGRITTTRGPGPSRTWRPRLWPTMP